LTSRPPTADPRVPEGGFAIPGVFVSAEPHGSGHINDTFLATYEVDGRLVRYIHQRINTQVFTDPEALMDNVSRVVAHLAAKGASTGDARPPECRLELVPANDGRSFYRTGDGRYWRTFNYVEGCRSLDVVGTPAEAREAAALFGRFQRRLADLAPPRLHETIAGFHDTGARYAALTGAAGNADRRRKARGAAEIACAERHAALATSLTRQLADGTLPERVTHNDTKLNNVLLDSDTGRGVCVIDLDTVMPGTVLYDFGDMVRTATMMAPEDEPDTGKISMNRRLFEALVEGYADSTADWLTVAEREGLALSASVMTYEVALRFLTDYLNGDRYFRIGYPDHNLVRARAQFALLECLQRESDYMADVVRRAFGTDRAAEG